MTTTKSIDSYRLTDLEEPTDKMLAQIMRDAAEDARKANPRIRILILRT